MKKRAPVILVNERDEWRDPVIAAVEECYDETTMQTGRRSVRWILKDNKQFDHLRRLAEGTICAECLESFPERPSPASVKRFGEIYGGKPGAVQLPWRERVMAGCCPVCGSEVSTEMFEALHEGTLPPIHDIEEDA